LAQSFAVRDIGVAPGAVTKVASTASDRLKPPEDPDDLQPGGSEQSYERIFADLFRRFWREPQGEVPPGSAAPTADLTPQD
jgi:hypothetical protein